MQAVCVIRASMRCCYCRFLCRQRLGYRADKNAEYLVPVPSESVVYGSGETAVVLSKVHFAVGHHESLLQTACCSKACHISSGKENISALAKYAVSHIDNV
jgi:hypothetical protein